MESSHSVQTARKIIGDKVRSQRRHILAYCGEEEEEEEEEQEEEEEEEDRKYYSITCSWENGNDLKIKFLDHYDLKYFDLKY